MIVKFLLIILLCLFGNYNEVANATVAACSAMGAYTGNGAQTTYVYNCKLQSASELRVIVNGVTQTLTTHYSVSSVGSASGNVVFVTAPSSGASIIFLRNVTLAQSSVYTPNEAFPAVRIESDYDKAMMAIQQLQEQINRAYRVIEGQSYVTPPNRCSGGQKMDGFDSSGQISCATDLNAAAATANQWDQITNPAGNQSLSMGANRSTWGFGAFTGTGLSLSFTGDYGASDRGLKLLQQTGNPTGGFLFELAVTDTDIGIAKAANTGGDGVQITGAGVLSKVGSGSVVADAFTGELPIANGGCGQATQATCFDALAPTTTKGDLIGHDGTNNVRVPVGSNNTGLIASSGETAGVKWVDQPAYVIKTADEVVNASATLQDDDELLFACAANTSYSMDLVLLLNAANATADFKFGWTVPASATMFWAPLSEYNSSGNAGGAPTWGVGVTTHVGPPAALGAASTLALASANVTNGVMLKGIVRCAGTAGNIQFQWSQNTSNASDSKVLKDSHLIFRRLQ